MTVSSTSSQLYVEHLQLLPEGDDDDGKDPVGECVTESVDNSSTMKEEIEDASEMHHLDLIAVADESQEICEYYSMDEINQLIDNIKLLIKRLNATSGEKRELLKKVDELTELEERLREELQCSSQSHEKLFKVLTLEGDEKPILDVISALMEPEERLGDKPEGNINISRRKLKQQGHKKSPLDVTKSLTNCTKFLPVKSSKTVLKESCEESARNEPAGCDVTLGTRKRGRPAKVKSQYDEGGKSFIVNSQNASLNSLDDGSDQDDSKNHAATASSQLQHTCFVCHKSFKIRCALNNHLRIHGLASGPLDCLKCDIKFTNQTALMSHLKTHEGRAYYCDDCNKNLATRERFKRHMLRHAGVKSVRCVECSLCGRKLISEEKLKLHMKRHTGDLRYLCTKCGKRFLTLANLEQHMQFHSLQKFPCRTCGRNFSCKASLSYHESVHANHRPFLCTICGKSYVLRRMLQFHMLSHDTERKATHDVKCVRCGDVLPSYYKMRIHLYKSHGVILKEHKCPDCGKVFVFRGDLNTHRLRHGRVKSYQCSLCSKQYKTPNNLYRHQKQQHNASGSDQLSDPARTAVGNAGDVQGDHLQTLSDGYSGIVVIQPQVQGTKQSVVDNIYKRKE